MPQSAWHCSPRVIRVTERVPQGIDRGRWLDCLSMPTETSDQWSKYLTSCQSIPLAPPPQQMGDLMITNHDKWAAHESPLTIDSAVSNHCLGSRQPNVMVPSFA